MYGNGNQVSVNNITYWKNGLEGLFKDEVLEWLSSEVELALASKSKNAGQVHAFPGQSGSEPYPTGSAPQP